MIAVLSYKGYEQGTDPVVDWLLYYKANFVRINMHDLFSDRSDYYIDINNNEIVVNNMNISQAINVVWFRRFYQELSLNDMGRKHFLTEQANYEINHEMEFFIDHAFKSFDKAVWMPSPKYIDVNKLTTLLKAKSIGLSTPNSIITNNKKDLLKFFNTCPKGIICKPINHSDYFVVGKYTHATYTTELTREMVEELPPHFFPTLFQEKAEAEYEVRVFYLDGKLYPTAMINGSPNRDVDIKLNYESNKTAWVNYTFPKKIEKQIIELMDYIGLNTGSLDVIKTTNGDYCFLEVNPVGQYSAPSDRGNYAIEKLIAEWLIRQESN